MSAKELDQEPSRASSRTPLKNKTRGEQTGNYYYGARYYNPTWSVWLGVDPWASKYPHVTPYNFVENNPIMLVDPDGNGPFPTSGPISGLIYSVLTKNYETNGQSILERPGSALSYLAHTTPATNTCAIRMSEAFNLSGSPIPSSTETPMDVRIQNGSEADNGNFVLDAVSMNNYLEHLETPTLSFDNLNSQEKIDKAMSEINKLGDFKGIITIIAGDRNEFKATGHVDLLYQDAWGDISLYSKSYFNDLDDYLVWNKDANLSIRIWIIKPEENE